MPADVIFRKLRQLKEERRNSTKVFMLLTLLQIQFSCGEKYVSCPLLLLMESQYRLLEG